MNKGLFKNSNINYSLILLIISMLSILGLYITDKSNIYNYIFAVVFLIVIYILMSH
jgi:NADH:ubiquinone oxidoreductase subunit 6 (subunit J)